MRLLLCLLLSCLPGMLRAEQCLVIGDSLTKEYEAEFPALFPNNPAAWQARNWIEILHQHRTDWFDTGTWSTYRDPRLTGHRFNWAFPGATTTEIKSQLNSFFSKWWTDVLKDQLRVDVERVVIFAGGNDADSYYADLYNGIVGPEVTNTTLSNLQWIVNYVRTVNASLPIVLVSVPHVGCTPKVQQGYPTDSVKTGRVTAAMDALNASLAAYAQSQGIGFAPGVYEFTKNIIAQPFRIKGIEFYRVADADARTRYVYAGDGFHPNTCAHTKIAQLIVAAFNEKYPSTVVTPLDDSYIITHVLGLDLNLPFTEWLAAEGVSGPLTGFADDADGDGVPNLIEFALEGFSANISDTAQMPRPLLNEGVLTLTYHPRGLFIEWGAIHAEFSTNLKLWDEISPTSTIHNADGSITVNTPFANRGFLRLRATN